MIERIIKELMKERKAYREYYLASEENIVLGETVGVSQEQWDANQKRLQKVIEECAAIELKHNPNANVNWSGISDDEAEEMMIQMENRALAQGFISSE
jgi:hypothetical protein